MVQALIYLLILSVFTLDYLVGEFDFIPRIVSWFPEVISGALLLLVAIRAAMSEIVVPPEYVLRAALMFMLILIGILINDVGSGTIFYDMRNYFLYVAAFLAPMAFAFSDDQIRRQMLVVLKFALVQIPFAVYQRIVDFPIEKTSDVLAGTVGSSKPPVNQHQPLRMFFKHLYSGMDA